MKPSIVALSLLALSPLPALADPYVFIGGAFGNIDMDKISNEYQQNAATTGSVSTSDSVSRAVVGVGARINANLGLEASYMSNSDNSVESNGYKDELSHDGYQLAAIGYLPVARNVDFYAKVSANYINSTYSSNFFQPAAYYSDSKSQTDFGWGVGAEFNLAPNMTLRAGFEQIQLQHVASSYVLGTSSNFNVNEGDVGLLVFF